MNQFRKTHAEVDLAALASNYKLLKSLVSPEQFFCPMVKANAYGHGAIESSRALIEAGATDLGVALVEEALDLRQNGNLGTNIFVFGLLGEEGAKACVESRLTPVLSSWSDIQSLSLALPTNAKFPVHVKFNTGMYRLGFDASESTRLFEFFRNQKRLILTGLCTHLASGEDFLDENGMSRKQVERFMAAIEPLRDDNVKLHILNSSALLTFKSPGPWGARPGIALYGIGNLKGLKPVMHFRSHVGKLHAVPTGETVSYGGKWRAERPSQIAVVGAGYADGIMRLLTNRGQALVRGERVPMVGTVCMDYIMLDVTELATQRPVEPGEPVTLWGCQDNSYLSAAEVADHAETIAYEVFTSVSQRVPRIYTSSKVGNL